ncbi:uncharacterized protein [Rutidosis leptorrhynchoides]|uniref:uncharacterized protein isoform X2 n=1 Tax=Rutidosis leptorrhynchoides TaxID=125765 RepID=UPI003A9A2094
MDQFEEDSFYHSLEEEPINVDSLLVEPRSDQVSVSGVWCYEEDNIAKCIKNEDASYNIRTSYSNINAQGLETTKCNAPDVLPHEVGAERLLAVNGISTCDNYLLDIGYVEQSSCMDYVSNEILHVANSSSENPFPIFRNTDKGSFGIQNSSTKNIPAFECQKYFIDKTMFDFGDKFEDYSKSFTDEENNENIMSPHVGQNGMEITEFCKDGPKSSVQDHGIGEVTNKRSRKPTQRYIDESSRMSLMKCKKRKEGASVLKVKTSAVRRLKHQNESEHKRKEKMSSCDISFDYAIQVPFDCEGPTECQKNTSPKKSSPAKVKNDVGNYLSGSEDDSEVMKSITSGNQRKLHKLWTVSEVKKLLDGVAHFGVGKWTRIKKLLFSSSVHRTPVDLKDKWRNLLKASGVLKVTRIKEDPKRCQPWRPLPKSILCRVRELASVYPSPNSKISKSKFPLAQHVSSPARIKGSQVLDFLK